MATPYKVVDVTDPASEAEAIALWEQLTSKGGEGMVVKPLDLVAKGKRGLVQPAVKCRGREYLRIIYGPEYTLGSNLERLRKRGLSVKRSLALRESPWVSRRSSGSCEASRCGACTSACSECLH